MPIPPQPARIRVREADGSPSARIGTIIVSNGRLTDNGDGTATLTSSAGSAWAPLTTGDPVAPALIFDSFGQVVMTEVLR